MAAKKPVQNLETKFATLFAERLRVARARAGIKSQSALGRGTDLNQSRISKWERAEVPDAIEMLREICVALNVSADELLGLPPRTTPPGGYWLLDQDEIDAAEAGKWPGGVPFGHAIPEKPVVMSSSDYGRLYRRLFAADPKQFMSSTWAKKKERDRGSS